MKRSVLLAALLLAVFVAPAGAQATATLDSATIRASRELARIELGSGGLEAAHREGARQAALRVETAIVRKLNRPLTDAEKQRHLEFWRAKMAQVLSNEDLVDMLAPVVARDLTLDEMHELSRFYTSPIGAKALQLGQDLIDAGPASGARFAKKFADEKWVRATTNELKAQFPDWFPGEAPGK